MPLNYTLLPTQLGAYLKNLRKLEAQLEHALRASAATHNRRLLSQANGLRQTDTEEARAYGKQLAFFDSTLAPGISSLWQQFRDQMESLEDLFGILAVDIPISEDDKAASPLAIEYEYEDINGAISIAKRKGVWGALYNDMVAFTEYVTANVITFGTFTAKSGNRGTLTVGSMTGRPHALTGTLVLEVVDESVDAPKLSVVNELTNPLPDLSTFVKADRDLQCEKSFEDGQVGLVMTINRDGLTTPTESGDNGNIFSATSIATPKEGDMNGGTLQGRVTRMAVAPIWNIEFFNSSARTTKVGGTTADTTTGTVALDVTLQNGTRFQSTFDRAAAHALLPAATNNDNDIQFDIKTPRIGDRWTRTITNDEAGNFSTKLAKLRRVHLPTSGVNLWTDSLAGSESVT